MASASAASGLAKRWEMLAAVAEEGERARFLGREVECEGCWEVGTDSGIRSDIVVGVLVVGVLFWGVGGGGCAWAIGEVSVVISCAGWVMLKLKPCQVVVEDQMGNYFGHSEFPQGKD